MTHRGKRSASDVTDWHRLFGTMLKGVFDGSDWDVDLELDLSIKQQFLDIVVIRRGQGHKTPILPDGLGPLADHNLITYKSLHEPLDDWALKELVGISSTTASNGVPRSTNFCPKNHSASLPSPRDFRRS